VLAAVCLTWSEVQVPCLQPLTELSNVPSFRLSCVDLHFLGEDCLLVLVLPGCCCCACCTGLGWGQLNTAARTVGYRFGGSVRPYCETAVTMLDEQSPL